MELTAPPGHGAEEDGRADNQPSDGNLNASQYARLDQRIGLLTDLLLGVKDELGDCDRMLRDLTSRRNIDVGRHETIFMVNPATQPVDAKGKGKAIVEEDDTSGADLDVILPNSPIDGEDDHFVPGTELNQEGSHLWATGITKSNGDTSSRKWRADCEASNDKRRRIEAPSADTVAPNGNASYVPNLEGVQITTLEVNTPLNLSRLHERGGNAPAMPPNIIRRIPLPPRNLFIGMAVENTPPALPPTLEMYFMLTLGMGLTAKELKMPAYIFQRQPAYEG
ncbi:hypothetical protein PIB30_055230 [Stylosanthes scabra]|uniref:Uncharacterized protein n=1 Tax=Stylosanthes scabra TaxID=79078 RepID=A0ABU6UM15_9FABA|nr:hypothetical protein [Stylosanthes scabra]